MQAMQTSQVPRAAAYAVRTGLPASAPTTPAQVLLCPQPGAAEMLRSASHQQLAKLLPNDYETQQVSRACDAISAASFSVSDSAQLTRCRWPKCELGHRHRRTAPVHGGHKGSAPVLDVGNSNP